MSLNAIKNFKDNKIFKRVECKVYDNIVDIDYYPKTNAEEHKIDEAVANLFVAIVESGYRPLIGLGYE